MATDAAIDCGEPAGDAPAGAPAIAFRRPGAAALLTAALAVQSVSTAVFLGLLWSEILGLRTFPIPYEWQEYLEILASLGLIVGFATTLAFLRRAQASERRLKHQIDAATGNFEGHLARLFAEWSLSASEREVTIYAMKGFSNAEIADLRGTTAATVKSQLNAVYRKSGMSNRPQLISFLVEELLSGVAASAN